MAIDQSDWGSSSIEVPSSQVSDCWHLKGNAPDGGRCKWALVRNVLKLAGVGICGGGAWLDVGKHE